MGMTLKKNLKFSVRETKHSLDPDYHIAPVLEDGMSIVAIGYVKLSDIDSDHANMARITGVLSTHVSELSKKINDGLYKGWAHEPPVINTDGKLVAGKHRYDAHDKSGKTEMWVAVCEFSGESVEVDYALSENLRSDPKRESDAEDVYFNTMKYFKCPDIVEKLPRGITKNAIRTRLNRFSWKGGSVEAMVERIYKEFDKEYVTVENPDWKYVVDAWYSEMGVDIVNDTGYSMETLRANGNSVEKTDRYARIRRKHLPTLLEGKDVTLITKLSDSNSEEIVSGRKHIEETFMSNMISEAYAIVDAHKSGKFGTINWDWVGQLPGEELIMENDNES